MKILIIRMLGFGDVVAIGVPAARMIRDLHPDARITFLTLGAGGEVMSLVPEVDDVMTIQNSDWPDQLIPALRSFAGLAQRIKDQGFDLVYNLDTFFMPCAMARMLAESGIKVLGNQMHWTLAELLSMCKRGTLEPQQVRHPSGYLISSFPEMARFRERWWDENPTSGPYPRFYLEECCEFQGPLDSSLQVPLDESIREEAGERPIVAVALSGRTSSRAYPSASQLVEALESSGYFVWSRFDGSQSMEKTLGQLRATDLLITVASAPQWLAQAVDCPTLMIPGHVPPAVLNATVTIPAHLECQFCMIGHECMEKIDYACLDVPLQVIVDEARRFLAVAS